EGRDEGDRAYALEPEMRSRGRQESAPDVRLGRALECQVGTQRNRQVFCGAAHLSRPDCRALALIVARGAAPFNPFSRLLPLGVASGGYNTPHKDRVLALTGTPGQGFQRG